MSFQDGGPVCHFERSNVVQLSPFFLPAYRKRCSHSFSAFLFSASIGMEAASGFAFGWFGKRRGVFPHQGMVRSFLVDPCHVFLTSCADFPSTRCSGCAAKQFMRPALPSRASCLLVILLTTTVSSGTTKELAPVPNSREVIPCDSQSEVKNAPVMCTRVVLLGEQVSIICPPGSDYFGPVDWTARGDARVCINPIRLRKIDRPRVCAHAAHWSDFGAIVVRSAEEQDTYRVSLNANRPIAFDRPAMVYGLCGRADDRESQPFMWKMRLVPEDAPQWNSLPYFYDATKEKNASVSVALYRGEAVELICHPEAEVVPSSALYSNGKFCTKPIEDILEKCESTQSWDMIHGGYVSREAADHGAVFGTAPAPDGSGETVNAYLQCKYDGLVTGFHIRFLPKLPPHVLDKAALSQRVVTCYPGDGPDPDDSCTVMLSFRQYAWINCNGLNNFDPPDINSRHGSFCVEKYENSHDVCKKKRRWVDSLSEAAVYSDRSILSIFNDLGNSKPFIAFGRCSSPDGRALFFSVMMADARGNCPTEDNWKSGFRGYELLNNSSQVADGEAEPTSTASASSPRESLLFSPIWLAALVYHTVS